MHKDTSVGLGNYSLGYFMSHQVSYDCLIIILQKKKPIWYKTLEKEK